MTLDDAFVSTVQSIKYPCVTINREKSLSLSTDSMIRSFICVCNCIYARDKDAKELIRVALKETYCLPISAYASAAVKYAFRQKDELNACWNSIDRKLFGFNKCKSLKGFICGLGRLHLNDILKKDRMIFY